MNVIFVKEVSDTVLNNKMIKLSHNSIGHEDYIFELCIGNKAVKYVQESIKNRKNINNVIEAKKTSFINNLILKINLNKFNKKIQKIINEYDFIGYSAIYSNELKKNKDVKKYIATIFEKFNINEYLCLGTVKDNMNKYIDEYKTNNGLKNDNINPLVIANNLDNLNLNIIENLNDNYKEINIFTPHNVNKSFQRKIEEINDEYGSCIQILGRTEKDFRKYNVYIFIDEGRTGYTRYKFSRKACFIDFTNKESDKFNKKYLMLEKGIKQNIYYSDKIKEMYDLYGKITVANSIIE